MQNCASLCPKRNILLDSLTRFLNLAILLRTCYIWERHDFNKYSHEILHINKKELTCRVNAPYFQMAWLCWNLCISEKHESQSMTLNLGVGGCKWPSLNWWINQGTLLLEIISSVVLIEIFWWISMSKMHYIRHHLNIHIRLLETTPPPKKKKNIINTRPEKNSQRLTIKIDESIIQKYTCHTCNRRHNKKSIIIMKQKSFPAQAPHVRYLQNEVSCHQILESVSIYIYRINWGSVWFVSSILNSRSFKIPTSELWKGIQDFYEKRTPIFNGGKPLKDDSWESSPIFMFWQNYSYF